MATKNNKITDSQLKQDKTDRIMETVAKRAQFYRYNPQRFCKDYLGLKLKTFQKILIWAMMKYDMFMFIQCRGIGKTYLTQLFAVCRCLLFPGTKCCCFSQTYKQGREIILKITDDFMQKSPMLCSEVSKWSSGQNDCYVYFKCGSWIRVLTASDTSRGARQNIAIIDEARMISNKIIDTVIRPMNASPRQPGYLYKEEYQHLKEMNKELYLSSAWFAQSSLYDKMKSYCANMLDENMSYIVFDLPYQLSIKEGLLMRESIENEMSEQTFSEISFAMEREGIFYGSAEDALFDFDVLNNRRILTDSFKSLEYYQETGTKVPEKKKDEVRVLSVDIALMGSKKNNNDASQLIIHSAVPTSSNNYIDNIMYIESHENIMAEDLGLIIMRMFYGYYCDYIAIDQNGVGQPIVDYLMSADRYDPATGNTYAALNCINNQEIADRCKIKGALKRIYAIKANQKSNNDMCLSLRAGFQNGYVNLLADENSIEDQIEKTKGYQKLSQNIKDKMLLPYIQTTFLIEELINLSYETSTSGIKVKEKSGMRKDKFSSCQYGYYVIQELSKSLKPRSSSATDIKQYIQVRAPKSSAQFNR